MPSATVKRITPELALAGGIGVAGAAKLAGAQFTRDNFERWGYPDSWRPLIGAVEVATAAAVALGRHNDAARRIGAAGALSTMGGAIATHVTAGEPPRNLLPPVLLATLGFATLFKQAA